MIGRNDDTAALVVEEYASLRHALVSVLGDEGFVVTEAASLQELGDGADGPQPELVLIDCNGADRVRATIDAVRRRMHDAAIVCLTDASEEETTALAELVATPKTALVRLPAGVDDIVHAVDLALNGRPAERRL